MTRVLRQKLNNKIDNLAETYAGLKNLQKLSLEDLENNIKEVWAVSFGLVAAIESVLDISQYLLSDNGLKTESYGQIPNKLLEAGLVDKSFASDLQKMIGFRNRLIHNYPPLDLVELHNILINDIKDFKRFLDIVNKL